MAEKLIIVMANTDTRNGEELGAPIFQATVAAAMEYEVDVICTATSGRLMKKGVAEKLFVKEGSPKSVYDFIKDAHEAGSGYRAGRDMQAILYHKEFGEIERHVCSAAMLGRSL